MTNKQNKKRIITAFNNCTFIVQVYVLLFEPFYGRYLTIQNQLQLGIDVKQFLENLKLINMILKTTKYPMTFKQIEWYKYQGSEIDNTSFD